MGFAFGCGRERVRHVKAHFLVSLYPSANLGVQCRPLPPFFSIPCGPLEALAADIDLRVGFRRARTFPSRKRTKLMTRIERRLAAPVSDLKGMFPRRERKMAVSGAMRRSTGSKRLLGTLHLPTIVWPR